jgi:hypothetical protein
MKVGFSISQSSHEVPLKTGLYLELLHPPSG